MAGGSWEISPFCIMVMSSLAMQVFALGSYKGDLNLFLTQYDSTNID